MDIHEALAQVKEGKAVTCSGGVLKDVDGCCFVYRSDSSEMFFTYNFFERDDFVVVQEANQDNN